MSSKTSIILQARDRELLTALDLSPLDAGQLVRLSRTFEAPVTSEDYLRKRMLKLREAGLVEHFSYQTDSVGAAKYYKLTREGYRFVAGPHKPLPRRTYFNAVSPSLQNHTRRLADFVVHTLASAHEHKVKVPSFCGENRLELQLGERSMRLDAAAQFKLKGYRPYNCLFELDCGTEPVHSRKQRESLSQKVRFILDYERLCRQTFRHYVVFAAATPRLANYLQMVAELNPNPERRICFAATLDRYLAAEDPLRTPIFFDERSQRASILPSLQMRLLEPLSLEPTLEQELVLA
jgi:hypothetical protein